MLFQASLFDVRPELWSSVIENHGPKIPICGRAMLLKHSREHVMDLITTDGIGAGLKVPEILEFGGGRH